MGSILTNSIKKYMLFQNKLNFSKFSLVEHKVRSYKFEIGNTINMSSHSRSVTLIFQMVYSEAKIAVCTANDFQVFRTMVLQKKMFKKVISPKVFNTSK